MRDREVHISVIICCYNSARRLPVTLEHLAKQKNDSNIQWEVIVVDNNSTDNTAEIAIKEWESQGSPVELRVVSEPNSGLSNARKKGILESKGELIIFCDDDNWLANNYVGLAHIIMNQAQDIMMLGGIGEAVFESKKPGWFEQFYSNFAVGEHPKRKIGQQNVIYLYGAGFVIRKSFFVLLKEIGFESLLSDRKGKELTSGGDTEYCLVASLLGFRIEADSRLKFKHYMPANRMNLNYLKRWHYGFGKTKLYLDIYKHFFMKPDIPGQGLRLPFWIDTLLHKLKKLATYYPSVWFIREDRENLKFLLGYQESKGEIAELLKVKSNYLNSYIKVKNMADKFKLSHKTID